jgi:hypothetical protein
MKQFLSAMLLSFVTLSASAEGVKNPLYEELLNKGVAIPDGPTTRLPPPLFTPGKTAGNPNDLLEKAAGRVPLDLFLKRSVSAPFSLTITPIEKAEDQRRAQLISLSFVAYAKLETVLETDFLKQLLTGKDKNAGQANTFSPEELKARGIQLIEGPKTREQVGQFSLSLLEKVRIEGATRTLRTSLPHGIVYATELDDRFKNDKEHPNRWRPILRLEEDRLGPTHPYNGMAGYVVVTELTEPKDALLLEMQFLLHEPPEWFGGPNLLRSKLPIAIQDNVRGFRRKLVRD